MADTTEKKTYLVNVESNLKKYAEDAANAKKEIDALTVSTTAMKKAGLDNTAEYQKETAQLQLKKQEYRDLQKVVQAGIQLTNKELSYRQQLVAAQKISIQAIKDLGNGYIKNAQGIDVINPKLIAEQKNLEKLNLELIKHDQSLNSGATNVGRYGQAIETAFKDVGSKILSMVGPMAIIGAAIGVATKLWEGMKDAIMSTTFAIDLMNQAGAVSKQLFYDLAINGKMTFENLKNAAESQDELNKLRIRNKFEQLEIAKINREEQATRELAIDRTRTHAERLVLLNRVKDLEHQKTVIAVRDLTDELHAYEKLFKQQPANEKLMLHIIELRTQIEDRYTQEDQAMRRIETQRTTFMQEEIDKRKDMTQAWYKEIDDANKKAEDDAKKKHDEEQKRIKESQKALQDEVDRYNKEVEDKWNKEIEWQRQLSEARRNEAKSEYDRREEEHQARIEQEEAYANLELEIYETLRNSKIDLAASLTNLLNGIAGENKALQQASLVADRAFAIAQIIINTTMANNKIRASAAASAIPGPTYFAQLAANMALASIPININRAAAAIDIAAIVASTITGLSKSQSSGAGGSLSPTAISSSPTAVRASSAPVASSIFTQPQASQSQLNALSNQNLLTAADIANAISKLPPSVVTVEDINAKIKSVNKVSVRANI